MKTYTLQNWLSAVGAASNPDYLDLARAMEPDLHPVGVLEVLHAGEIISATWRLRRDNKVDETQLSPELRLELDKARVRTTNMIRRETTELRKLQSERQIREQLGTGMTGLASSRELIEVARLVRTANTTTPDKAPQPKENTEIQATEAALHAKFMKEQEACSSALSPVCSGSSKDSGPRRQTDSAALSPGRSGSSKDSGQRSHSQTGSDALSPNVGRNAPCPCRSGQKFKRCCGHFSKMAS